MELQAIIGLGEGLTFNEHSTIRLNIANILKKDSNNRPIIFAYMDSNKIENVSEGLKFKGKNLYIKTEITDPQGFYHQLSKNKYILLDSKLTQDCKISKDTAKLKEDFQKTYSLIKHKTNSGTGSVTLGRHVFPKKSLGEH